MSPQLHVKRFLEERKGMYTPGMQERIELGLTYYLDYLKRHGRTSLHVEKEFIESLKNHIYRDRCNDKNTMGHYLRGLRDFYRYLKERGLVDENPMEGIKLTRIGLIPLKERSYSDEELIRAYTESWRRQYGSPSRIRGHLRSWVKLRELLKKTNQRLQTLDRSALEELTQGIDSLRTRRGRLLNEEERYRTLGLLKGLLRWLQRNGYRREDPAQGYSYQFRAEKEPESNYEEEPYSEGWKRNLEAYLQDCRTRLRPNTVKAIGYQMRCFLEHLTKGGIQESVQIQAGTLEKYRALLYERVDITENTRCRRLRIIKGYMDYLERTDQIIANPARKIAWPKYAQGLPTRLMSPHDVKMLLGACNLESPYGLRNRAIYELMYSTGLRVGEVAGLRLEDIDYDHGLIRVQEPKGGPNFQRIVPIGSIALDWVKRYIEGARDQFPVKEGYERRIFLSRTGKATNVYVVTNAMKDHCLKLKMRKTYSSHSWRVTCATEMLRYGADIRHVQEQLGHRNLNSTKLYTRLLPLDLKKIHQKTHPREREYRRDGLEKTN